jgi:hypothetical protein
MTGLPLVKLIVLRHVITLPLTAVEIVLTGGRLTLMVGGDAYPLSNPCSLISIPGGKLPAITLIKTGLFGIGFSYSIGISTHVLSKKLLGYVLDHGLGLGIGPDVVVNLGLEIPEIEILNVLSLIFCRLSVALTTKVYVVVVTIDVGTPAISPFTDMLTPEGKLPLMIL